MALTHVASSAWVSSVSSVTPGVPTGTAAGDFVIVTLVSKYDDASLGDAPAGWTDLSAAVANTGRPTGADNGNLRARAFYRVWQAGDSMPALAPTPNNVSTTKASTYRVAAGQAVGFAGGLYVDDTTGSPLAFATGSTLGLASGDVLHVDQVLNGDAPTWGTTTASATGATFGAIVTNTADLNTTTGSDLRMRAVRFPVNSGTATGNLTVSTTLAGTTTNAVGVGLVLRLREVAPSNFTQTPTDAAGLADTVTQDVTSPNILVVGSATTSVGTGNRAVTKPTGVTEGDVLLGFYNAEFALYSDMTAPDGTWTLVDGLDGGTRGQHMAKVWYHVCGASEPASYTFGGYTSSDNAVTVLALRGVPLSGGVPTLVTAASTNSTDTCQSVAPTGANDLLVCFAATALNNTAGSFAAPGSMTEQSDVGTVWVLHTVATEQLTSGDATGTRDFTPTGTVRLTHYQLAVAVAAAVPLTQSPTDALGLTDVNAWDLGRLDADALGLADPVALGLEPAHADALGLADSATTDLTGGGSSFAESPTDALGLADSAVDLSVGRAVAPGDDAGLADAAAVAELSKWTYGRTLRIGG